MGQAGHIPAGKDWAEQQHREHNGQQSPERDIGRDEQKNSQRAKMVRAGHPPGHQEQAEQQSRRESGQLRQERVPDDASQCVRKWSP